MTGKTLITIGSCIIVILELVFIFSLAKVSSWCEREEEERWNNEHKDDVMEGEIE